MNKSNQSKRGYRAVIITIVILAVVAGLLYLAHSLNLLELAKQVHQPRPH